jgi:acetylornithine deacetylase/succinyl-diaminopimelate desuccinylase-like protein
MTIPPFDPAIRDGKVWGRGTTDTKGPMAAALWALRDWAKSSARAASRVEWTFLGLMGEEAGNDGAHAMSKKGFRSDLALVLEPTGLSAVTAHKGVLWMEIVTRGVACHGAMPDQGRNAIHAMRRVLEIFEEKIQPSLERRPHIKLGASTMNIGTIAGGSKINIVPDACRIEIDFRLVPGLDPAHLRAEIEAELKSVPDASIGWQRFCAPLDTDEKQPWIARLGRLSRGFAIAPWYSDASILGCPAVCVGPGSIAQAHTRDEFISLHDLHDGADFFRRWIMQAEAAAA